MPPDEVQPGSPQHWLRPRDDEPVDESEYRQALAIAEAILTWAQESIENG